ncbi:TetR/AcrR family transcriptional regulator [Thermomonospora catenispora]|uniref:TetR/AcrR family transcriptional regulator n=1 Tax=Thermomonospora catenispora TaxID=2493090 RepID=UPI00111E89D8|nr:TetR/AcrR family transcriptional regulator [Thermomonospora catenispora]TNY34852.1 TetR/AcrR family transcriptional regulator [Thermomonospora catenispora]
MAPAEPTAARPGRPRSARADKAIMEAVLDLLAEEGGVAGISMEAVAARAGVGKSTVYRRWPDKERLIVAALAALKGPLPEPPGRSAREDLLVLARAIAAEHSGRRGRCVWNALGGADKHPELMNRYREEVLEPRRELMRRVLRRGIAAGELRADLDVEAVVTVLVGAMTMPGRAPAPFDDDVAERLPDMVVDVLMRGIGV